MGFRPPILRGVHGYGQAVAGQTRDIHGIQRKQNLLTRLVAISFRIVPHICLNTGYSEIDEVSARKGISNG